MENLENGTPILFQGMALRYYQNPDCITDAASGSIIIDLTDEVGGPVGLLSA